MIDAYFRTRTCLGEAANRQKIYYNRDTKPRHLKKGDWVINWHKYTVMQTLSNGWIGPFVVTFKSGTCWSVKSWSFHQDRANWVRDELAHCKQEQVIDVGTNPIKSRMTAVGVSIAYQTTDTDTIVVTIDNIALMSTVRRSLRPKTKPSHFFYYLQI